ncbi:DUF397 domain-containing protein [Micromonospora sp. NBC_01796]|uniref:DUF397 domain-containing protein n=1 Tax=Micromonospora sp. NBC_01796 TaxID=2975987 RepID=UPI002DDAB8D5|nr:DUF397 domain-containing protein [Micromonospora sp. NBC_01796]WSA83329.1 DUF397 domain-containing protein [Micromonospora sp. NBC_01796]
MSTPDLSRAHWVKSSRSTNNGACVECAFQPASAGGSVAVRDSKDPSGPVLVFDRSAWAAFLATTGRILGC